MSYKGRGWEKRRSRKHSQESRNKNRGVREVEMRMLRWILGSLRECLTKEEVGRRGGVENIVKKV